MRRSLLSAIEVLDNAPNIVDLGPVIESRLRMIAPRGKVSLAREHLEGWWWPRICATLQAAQPSAISILELEQKLDEIRESLKRDALPLDMEEVDPPQEELDALEEMRFVRQLRAVGIGSNRLQFAKRDYYRAFTQRSRWTRQSLLFDTKNTTNARQHISLARDVVIDRRAFRNLDEPYLRGKPCVAGCAAIFISGASTRKRMKLKPEQKARLVLVGLIGDGEGHADT